MVDARPHQAASPALTGVGTRVTLKGDKDDTLGRPGHRQRGQGPAGIALRAPRGSATRFTRWPIKTDKFSTKFEDWIEKDLLKLNAFDVREVQLNDYSANVGPAPMAGRRWACLAAAS